MPMEIKSTFNYQDQPRFLIYGDPGASKTTLAATCATPGERDLLFASTEGGLQSIGHLDLPYVDVKKPGDWDELVKMLRAGKPDGQGGIQIDKTHLIRGVVVDLFGEIVQMNLMSLLVESKRYKEDPSVIDDPSQYEYRQLNMRMIRQIRQLRDLPLRYVGLTAYSQDVTDDTGNLIECRPSFVGSQIWRSASGAMSYVFRVAPPRNSKEAQGSRIIQLQPGAKVYAKARIPGVAGKLPIEDQITWKMGDTTILRDTFAKIDNHIARLRAEKVA